MLLLSQYLTLTMQTTKTIIFDLDHTLLNTKRLNKDSFVILKKAGATDLQINDSYKYLLSLSRFNYNFTNHAKAIQRKYKMKLDFEIINNFLNSSFKKYLNKGALLILNYLKKNNWEIILLTAGNPQYQKIKIKQSGLADYFDKILISHGCSKNETLKKYINKEAVFVNDFWDETKGIMKEFKKFTYILYQRADWVDFYKENDIAIPMIKNFSELKGFLTALN